MTKTIHKMQRYIVGCVRLIVACGATYPIAMNRVSEMKEFPGQSVRSQDCANKDIEGPQKVIAWETECAPLTVVALPKK